MTAWPFYKLNITYQVYTDVLNVFLCIIKQTFVLELPLRMILEAYCGKKKSLIKTLFTNELKNITWASLNEKWVKVKEISVSLSLLLNRIHTNSYLYSRSRSSSWKVNVAWLCLTCRWPLTGCTAVSWKQAHPCWKSQLFLGGV